MNSICNKFNDVNDLYEILVDAIAESSDHFLDSKGKEFWRRFHGYGLYRICFIAHEHYYSDEGSYTKSINSFLFFDTYDEVRNFYQFRRCGRHQLDILKSDSFSSTKGFVNFDLEIRKNKDSNVRSVITSRVRFFLNRLILAFNSRRSIRAVILRSYIPLLGKFKILFKSRFRTAPFLINFPILDTKVDAELRLKFVNFVGMKLNNHFDEKFINYLVNVLFIMLPTSCIEGYQIIREEVKNSDIVKLNPRYVINESITDDHQISIISTLLKHFCGTEFIYNEHNKITKVFRFNTIFIIERLVDTYLTHGWTPDQGNISAVRSSTLYKGFHTKHRKKNIQRWALYVTGVGYLYESEFSNSSLSHSAEYLSKYLYERERIFAAFDYELNRGIDYKPYNRSRWELTADIDEVANKNKLNVLDYNIELTAIYHKYELIIIDYLSTAYTEVMLLDIPVLVLYTGEVNEPDIYGKLEVDALFECGVFHDCGDSLGNFAKTIFGKEQEWWMSEKVGSAVNGFLSAFINRDNDLINKISSL